MKKEIAILSVERVSKSLKIEIEYIEVEVMARSGAYAMVRRKGCYPFVARNKNLRATGGCET